MKKSNFISIMDICRSVKSKKSPHKLYRTILEDNMAKKEAIYDLAVKLGRLDDLKGNRHYIEKIIKKRQESKETPDLRVKQWSFD